jgi:hypothetical protein
MVDEIAINRATALHRLKMAWDAPPLWTTTELLRPVEDFDRLYRMSTGIFGRRDYRGMSSPFPYARPYISEAHFGSPLWLELIVPTVVFSANFGLPNLLELVQQTMLLPSKIAAERQRNLRDARGAELERLGIEERLRHPDTETLIALSGQEVQLVDLETRRLRAASEQRDLRAKLDSPGLADQVVESYGSAGVSGLLDVVRHAEDGPARPRSLEVHPTDSSAGYPKPPKTLPPPQPRHPDQGS